MLLGAQPRGGAPVVHLPRPVVTCVSCVLPNSAGVPLSCLFKPHGARDVSCLLSGGPVWTPDPDLHAWLCGLRGRQCELAPRVLGNRARAPPGDTPN